MRQQVDKSMPIVLDIEDNMHYQFFNTKIKNQYITPIPTSAITHDNLNSIIDVLFTTGDGDISKNSNYFKMRALPLDHKLADIVNDKSGLEFLEQYYGKMFIDLNEPNYIDSKELEDCIWYSRDGDGVIRHTKFNIFTKPYGVLNGRRIPLRDRDTYDLYYTINDNKDGIDIIAIEGELL